MEPNQIEELDRLLDFIMNAPLDETVVQMDCNENCQDFSFLAERVANGESLEDIMPELKHHMQYWEDCRDEFHALVSVLKAEMLGELPEIPVIDE